MTDQIIEFRVEQEHIDEGVKGSCSKCPVALALDVTHPDSKVATLQDRSGLFAFTVADNRETLMWEFDACTTSKVFHFDGSGKMEPFTARAKFVERLGFYNND